MALLITGCCGLLVAFAMRDLAGGMICGTIALSGLVIYRLRRGRLARQLPETSPDNPIETCQRWVRPSATPLPLPGDIPRAARITPSAAEWDRHPGQLASRDR